MQKAYNYQKVIKIERFIKNNGSNIFMDTSDKNLGYDDGILLRVDKRIKTEDIIAGRGIDEVIADEIAFADTRALTSEELDTVEGLLKQKAREERAKAAALTSDDGIWFSNGNDPGYIAGLSYAEEGLNKGIEFDESRDNVLGRIDIALKRIESARKSVGESMAEQSVSFAKKAGELGTLVGVYSAELADESLTRFGRYIRDTAHGKTRLGKELFEISETFINFRDEVAIPYVYREEPGVGSRFIPAEESGRLLKKFYAWSRDSALPWIKNKAGPSLTNRLTRTNRRIRREILRPVRKSLIDPLVEKIKNSSRARISDYYTPDPSTGKLVLKKEIELGYAHAIRKSAPYILGAVGACTAGLIAYNSGTDFTKVNSRDQSAVVFRYELSAEEKKSGANPRDVVRRFNKQYEECIENPLQLHDLRYVNGNRVFRRNAGVPEGYRMKEKNKGLYIKISRGPCAPKRKR